ncbi:MAG: UDP-N-acetylmuramate dehydrogenase, partial [Gemmatimonadota bacterium]|nr:UDP-N-acetylmuramate dehydrogenase [Gemmatimonadota bacterium]
NIGAKKVHEEEPLARHNTLRTGGPADVLFTPHTTGDLQQILRWTTAEEIPWIVLGNGSNMLFPDLGYRGVVLKIRGSQVKPETLWHLDHKGHTVSAGAGVSLARLAAFCADAGLSGMEWATGIPGVVGGSVKGNAGAHGSEMGEVVAKIDGMCTSGEICTLNRNELGFEYRHSKIPRDMLIVRTMFSMTEDDPERIRRRIQEYAEYRKKTQPTADQSAGCMFKNPEGDSAGRLIDVAGCKGMAEGGAMVSEHHANFIVNRGCAKSADAMRLINRIRNRVLDHTGIALTLEVRLVEEL